MKRAALVWLSTSALALCAALGPEPATRAAAPAPAAPQAAAQGCLRCHEGIEDMHPGAKLTCVDCHGGDENGRTKQEAHVRSLRRETPDERVPPIDEDLAWRRFRNPMDLRVAQKTCGECHEKALEHLMLSLHATTAGHLSDGYYEAGALPQKGSVYSVFPVEAPPGRAGDVSALVQVPAFREPRSPTDFGAHFGDLARKECLQCHLWSSGRAVRGRVGFDGDYRGEGCAACHVEYAVDGLSQSADKSAVRSVPGHPRFHRMTRAAPTATCTSCHYGDASIGLNYRGLAQLPPGAPGGPEIAGTTDSPLNRQFYLQDPALNPPDVHHERGMHCVDCHTVGDVMGDGKLHGRMEDAVEIGCADCHGTFTQSSTLRTARGTPLTNLRREGDKVILRGKIDGRDHEVRQLVHALDPEHKAFNPRAAEAMTPEHAGVACSTCHASWNPNFLGFHFDRNESLTQLDLLTGRRTSGRVTTQEKVFATWKSFFAGLDPRGRLMTYMTGFSSMGSVTDAKGERVLDQAMPVTAAGLSGLTMIHHEVHTTRKPARSCVECHRAPSALGLGSGNFDLARQVAYVADRRGIESVALDRSQLSRSVPLAKVVQPDIVSLALACDPLQGFGQHLYAAEASLGVHVFDVRDPTTPRRVAFFTTVDPRELRVQGDRLYVADGAGGLRIWSVADPAAPRELGRIATVEACAVTVSWPWAYVADGPGGLWVVDVRDAAQPRALATFLPAYATGDAVRSARVETLFQHSRPRTRRAKDGTETPIDERTEARHLAVLLDEKAGAVLVDVTEPTQPRQLYPDPAKVRADRAKTSGAVASNADALSWPGLVLASHVDLAQPQGGSRTVERDYAYLLSRSVGANGNVRATLTVLDVSDPVRPRRAAAVATGATAAGLTLGAFYTTPFLKPVLMLPGADGVALADLSVSTTPNSLGALSRIPAARAVAVEEFPLDRMLDEQDRPLKDVSHAGSRWLNIAEIERVLSVPRDRLRWPAFKEPAPSSAFLVAAREFERLDADRSGRLEGAEIQGSLARADADGDGRVLFAEFALRHGVSEAAPAGAPSASMSTPEPAAPAEAPDRTGLDGDLARLLDRVWPYDFDRDEDSRLDAEEMRAAWFAALDLDGDRTLSMAEMAREPGPARELRWNDAGARALFQRYDVNRDGRVQPVEHKLPPDAWLALDADGDGRVQLPVRLGSKAARSGMPAPPREWPFRQRARLAIAPLETAERLLGAFDADRDGVLTKKELQRRPELFLQLDANVDGKVTAAELQPFLDTVAGQGVEGVREGFLERWDLDGDGKVAADEIPVPSWLRGRLNLAPAGRRR